VKLKILIAHNRYQHAGGEDIAVARETALLEAAGHRVIPYLISNDDIRGLPAKVRTFLGTAHNDRSRSLFEAALVREDPDLVHVHNFFPLLSPAIHEACRAHGVPVIQTLHNYRTVCANAMMLRDGRTCDKCVGQSPYWGALHACYRESALASFAVARMISDSHRRGVWTQSVSRFIALSEHARSVFVRGGLPAEKIVVAPNFTSETSDLPPVEQRSGVLYVGRISTEKGINVLLDAVRACPDLPVRIAGDGPLLDQLRDTAPGHVEFLGQLNSSQIKAEMRHAAILAVPSICEEMFGTVIIEAFSAGLPVIASRVGGPAEIIDHGETGFLVEPGDAATLAETLRWGTANPEALNAVAIAALHRHAELYTPTAHLEQLETIYRDALAVLS
jgi:glycosyltransferase involved in cell wall biosynthesis